MNIKSRVEKLESKLVTQDKINSILIVSVPGPADDPDGKIVAVGIQSIEYERHSDRARRRWTRNEGESEEAFQARALAEATIEPGRVGWFLASYGEEC